MRVAMWSGPRNLSTAMMYSFASRNDCTVWDEPFYAAYLAATGLIHPMTKEILAAGITNATDVGAACLAEIPDGKTLFYQKHMTQHMLPQFNRDWMSSFRNVFLIRHPAKVLASYRAKRENPTFDDIGFWQQAEIFQQIQKTTGKTPTVIDSDDILADPEKMLGRLCNALGIPFNRQMLTWPKGPHIKDGAWAPHWYKSVWESDGFSKKPTAEPDFSGLPDEILEKSMRCYRDLHKYRL